MKKRADGRYCKQVLIGYHPDGRKKFKNIYGKTIKEVEKKERDIRDSIDKGILSILNEDIKVEKWVDEWMNTYKSNLSYNTIMRYKNIVDIHIKPHIGHYKLSQVKLVTVQKIINDMHSRNYSLSSIKKVRDAIHQIYQTAMINELAFKDPTVGVILPKITPNTREPVTSEIEDKIIEFANYKQENGDDIGIYAMTLLCTGLRRGEIVALTWKDVDFRERMIYVNKSVVFQNNRPISAPPKTKSGIREIPMLDILYDNLLMYKKHYIEKYGFNIEDKPIFVNTLGEQHSLNSIKKFWVKYLKEFNSYYNSDEKFGMHQLRHNFCTLLFRAGADMKTAQSILGHADISVTLKIYTHLNQNQKRESIEKLNTYINQNSNLGQSKISQNEKIAN